MSAAPLLDRGRLDELAAVGRLTETPLVRMLLTTYLDSLPATLDRIRAAVASDDAGALKLTAHSLKSSSAQLGAARLAAVCLELEHATPEAARPLLDALDREAAAIRPVFETERDQA